MLMGLALLPCDHIVEAFADLKRAVPTMEDEDVNKFERLHSYINNYWIKLVGIEKLSVFRQAV